MKRRHAGASAARSGNFGVIPAAGLRRQRFSGARPSDMFRIFG